MKFKDMPQSEYPEIYYIIANDLRPCEICEDMTEFLDEYGTRVCSEECWDELDRIVYDIMDDTLECGCCRCCGCSCEEYDEDFEE